MQLVVGLGNPGERYAATRHNIGFRCLEVLARALGLAFAEDRPRYRTAAGDGPRGPIVLLQPLTFMNRSGEALAAWAADTGRRIGQTAAPAGTAEPATAAGADAGDGTRCLNDEAAAVLPAAGVDPVVVPFVVCDDLHLPLGSLRIRGAGGDGGQNGLASILRVVGGEGVPRLRLGVGPREGAVDPRDWADYVLCPFAAEQEEAARELTDRGAEAALWLLEHGWVAAAARFNRRILPAGGP